MITKYNIKFHHGFFLLPKKFSAITLFGHVFTNKSKIELEKWLNTYSGKVMANHEYIHMVQANSFKTKYFGFYVYYIGYWIKNLFKYGFNMDAYRNIPFEKEAKAKQYDFTPLIVEWKKYI